MYKSWSKLDGTFNKKCEAKRSDSYDIFPSASEVEQMRLRAYRRLFNAEPTIVLAEVEELLNLEKFYIEKIRALTINEVGKNPKSQFKRVYQMNNLDDATDRKRRSVRKQEIRRLEDGEKFDWRAKKLEYEKLKLKKKTSRLE
ncbi:unnamed protein product [Caenorhabditis bovis]|uniref:Uncharacterized protein n=1 Tax=Caenorhabditis bovis TaxID=2654633 RepID=A0A8S1FCB3_9PELO|nr:unnamed protein product [Caenorhabditis bovis]